ncbi:MAG: type IX secretion system sortase PorU [Prevotella sp.]|nr:type IX secretion system sortase PorU [Prevotella sp.]
MKYVVTWLFCCIATLSHAQQFFNLTAEQVKIDTLMPRFGHSIPLGENFEDSTYTVEICYPEFIDMSAADIANYMKLSGEPLAELPKIEQNVLTSRREGFLSIQFVPFVFREGRYQTLVSFMLKVTSAPKKQKNAPLRTKKAPQEGRYAENSVLATGRWAKIRVAESGIYQITDELIKKGGFSDLSKVKIYGYGGHLQPEVLTEDYLRQTDDLQEVAQCIVDGRRLFYAKGPVSWSAANSTVRTRNPYSDYGYYFLTESDESPKTIAQEQFLAANYPLNDDYHVLHEVDNYAWFQGGRNLYENSPINSGSSKTYTLASPVSGTSGMLSVTASAGVNSMVNIQCNGQDLGAINIAISSINYEKGHATNRVFNLSDIKSTNEITLTTTSGGPVRLDYISLTLNEPKAAPNLQSDAFAVPEYVHNITNQNLHAHEATDMVIVIPTSQKLLSQAERLAQFHRDHDNLRVRIIPADELYNEFSSGTPDATAYKRYLKMLYDRAESATDMPRYLLLFGDCTWDSRMKTSDYRMSSTDDYLLCFESENSFSETYCYVADEFFCLLDDNESLTSGAYPYERPVGLADVAVGRFPVVTENAAKVMVDKVIAYAENKNAGGWQNTLVFMGDDGNNNIHMNDINDAANDVFARHPGFVIKKVMWDAFVRETSSTGHTYPEVSKLVKQYQQQGTLIMDYAGHGRADQISHETVLRLSDFENFTNQNLPLWITASCDIMPFDGATATIGETAVLSPKGGAIAFYGTARTVYVKQNKTMNMTFLKHVLSSSNGKPYTLGEAQMRAKNEMIRQGSDQTVNMLQYQLLGDPALPLNIPTKDVVIDEINGIPVAAGSQQQASLKAGSIARIKGHIVDSDDFNGILTAVVRDNEETIVCKLNNTDRSEGAQKAFTYQDRTKTLYNGSDSIRNGQFEFSFAVPKDINYADASGLVNIYAVNHEHTLIAHGSSDRFLVGGTETAGNDSIGPSIYCYLNSPSFTNGGNVNSTPYFVAQVNDQDGINASGNGIGHDLELIIDGDMAKTYILNDNFKFDFGSYTTGSTFYYIPELEPGMHTLLFRAWDVLNNSSTAQLTFNVVRGLEPTLFDVSCTQNPARTGTTFIISHDRMGSTIDIALDIFDTSGRHLWHHEATSISTDTAYTLPWDLTVDGGQRLQTGVYLYRVSISSDGSKKVSKAKKIVIIGS